MKEPFGHDSKLAAPIFRFLSLTLGNSAIRNLLQSKKSCNGGFNTRSDITTINGKENSNEEGLLMAAQKIGIAEKILHSMKEEIYALCRK